MSILITDLEMPAERESFNLTIKYNGTVLDTETGIQVAEAYELPVHGRLIDADAAVANRYAEMNWAYDLSDLPDYLADCPTIIPAEEGE